MRLIAVVPTLKKLGSVVRERPIDIGGKAEVTNCRSGETSQPD